MHLCTSHDGERGGRKTYHMKWKSSSPLSKESLICLFIYLFSCSLSSFNYGVSPCKLYAQVGGNYYVVFHFINPNFLASSRPHFTILTLWLLDFIFISLVVLQLTSWPSIFCICRFAWLVQFVEGG